MQNLWSMSLKMFGLNSDLLRNHQRSVVRLTLV